MIDSNPSPARPGLRERKKARTRAAIQACALGLFRERGYDGTTIEQIAAAADVSEATFFRYFPTKEDLVLQDDYHQLLFRTFSEQPAQLAPIPALRAALSAVFTCMTDRQRTELSERISLISAVPRLRAAMLGQILHAVELLADAMAERCDHQPSQITVRVVAGAIVGAAVAVSTALRDESDADLSVLIDQAIGHLEPGLTF